MLCLFLLLLFLRVLLDKHVPAHSSHHRPVSTMNNICGNPEQNGGANVSDCWARFHDTVAFGGTKPSPIWQLSPKYSVETRLLDALQQLHAATQLPSGIVSFYRQTVESIGAASLYLVIHRGLATRLTSPMPDRQLGQVSPC